MARIDALIATQIGDATRPGQTARESEAQSTEARRQENNTAEPRAGSPATPDQVKAAAERLQVVIETASGRQLNFAVNERFKELVVRISDRNSGEVIKEIPAREFMDLRERLNDLIGLFIDEKA